MSRRRRDRGCSHISVRSLLTGYQPTVSRSAQLLESRPMVALSQSVRSCSSRRRQRSRHEMNSNGLVMELSSTQAPLTRSRWLCASSVMPAAISRARAYNGADVPTPPAASPGHHGSRRGACHVSPVKDSSGRRTKISWRSPSSWCGSTARVSGASTRPPSCDVALQMNRCGLQVGRSFVPDAPCAARPCRCCYGRAMQRLTNCRVLRLYFRAREGDYDTPSTSRGRREGFRCCASLPLCPEKLLPGVDSEI